MTTKHCRVLLLSATLMLIVGCASTRPVEPREATAGARAQFGQMAVLLLNPDQSLTLQTPATKGEAAGASGSQAAFFWVPGSQGDATVAVFGLAWAPVGFLFGTTYGFCKAESADRVADALQVLTHATQGLDPGRDLQQQVVQAHALAVSGGTRTLRTVGADLATFLPRDPDSVHNLKHGLRRVENDYTSLAANGVDSVLELRVDQMGLLGPDRMNPPLQFWAQVRVRVISTGRNQELFRDYFEYRGSPYRFVAWAAEAGRLFRAEYQRCVCSVGEEIVGHVLGRSTEPVGGRPGGGDP